MEEVGFPVNGREISADNTEECFESSMRLNVVVFKLNNFLITASDQRPENSCIWSRQF